MGVDKEPGVLCIVEHVLRYVLRALYVNRRTARDHFFCRAEAKEAKTFAYFVRASRQRTQMNKSFLVLFFKKEHFLS
jgi:hypothetical protein